MCEEKQKPRERGPQRGTRLVRGYDIVIRGIRKEGEEDYLLNVSIFILERMDKQKGRKFLVHLHFPLFFLELISEAILHCIHFTNIN